MVIFIFDNILIGCTLIYGVTLILLLIGLFHLKKGTQMKQPLVSVIVPARNEAANICHTLKSLVNQTYPVNKLQLIIVDDRSTDQTAEIIQQFANHHPQIQLVQVIAENPDLIGKKNAITAGINASRGEIILATDADCVHSPDWVTEMVKYFEPEVGVVGGYIYSERPDESVPFWQRMRALERLGVVAVAAGTMGGWNLGVTCTAGNLAYRRQVFDEIDGFSAIGTIRSGDDDLFVQRVNRLTKWQFRYAAHPATFVYTKIPTAKQQLLNQEQRRASKGKYYPIWLIALLIPVFLMNVGFLIALLTWNWQTALYCFWGKAFLELLVMIRTCQIFKRWDLLIYFVPVQILYIPYFVFFAVAGSLGGYRWKD